MRKRIGRYVLLAVTLGAVAGGAGATEVGGVICENQLWDLAGSPWVVVDSVRICEGATLTIGPGAKVRLLPQRAIQIEGELVARGTKEQPILFTSDADDPVPGDWDYILFSPSSVDAVLVDGTYVDGSILQHCTIEFAGRNGRGAVEVDAASPFIDRCLIRQNAANGILIGFGMTGMVISHNTIRNNALSGISSNGSDMTFRGNRIEANGYYGIYSGYSSVLESNIIGGNGAVGVWVYDTICRRNLILDNGGGGLWLFPSSGSAAAQGNVIYANRSTTSCAGITSFDVGSIGIEIMRNTIVENETTDALTGSGTSACLTMSSTSVVEHNTVQGNFSGAPVAETSSIVFGGTGELHQNNLIANRGFELRYESAQGSPDLDATLNWWDSTDPEKIEEEIYDFLDDGSKALVDFEPFRLEINPTAPVPPPLTLSAARAVHQPTTIGLQWDGVAVGDRAGYRVYYDTAEPQPCFREGVPGLCFDGTGAEEGPSPIEVGDVTSFELTGLLRTQGYHLAVTAVDEVCPAAQNCQFPLGSGMDPEEVHESWFTTASVPPCSDDDGDGWCNGEDNCPGAYNPDQINFDDDPLGDACDPDDDDDGVADDGDGSGKPDDNPCMCGQPLSCDDNCQLDANGAQADSDCDGIGTVCDPSPDDLPDYLPTDVGGPERVSPGEIVDLEVVAQNAGAGSQVLPLTTVFFLSTDTSIDPTSDLLLDECAIPFVAPEDDGGCGVTVEIPEVAFDTYYWGVCADPDDEIPEADDANNCRAGNLVRVPEPSRLLLALGALASIGVLRRRRVRPV